MVKVVVGHLIDDFVVERGVNADDDAKNIIIVVDVIVIVIMIGYTCCKLGRIAVKCALTIVVQETEVFDGCSCGRNDNWKECLMFFDLFAFDSFVVVMIEM